MWKMKGRDLDRFSPVTTAVFFGMSLTLVKVPMSMEIYLV